MGITTSLLQLQIPELPRLTILGFLGILFLIFRWATHVILNCPSCPVATSCIKALKNKKLET